MKLATKTEWADEPSTQLPAGRYYGATGVCYEVTGYDHATDCVWVMRTDTGRARLIPRPLAMSMLSPVEIPEQQPSADYLVIGMVAAMGIVLGLIWWSW